LILEAKWSEVEKCSGQHPLFTSKPQEMEEIFQATSTDNISTNNTNSLGGGILDTNWTDGLLSQECVKFSRKKNDYVLSDNTTLSDKMLSVNIMLSDNIILSALVEHLITCYLITPCYQKITSYLLSDNMVLSDNMMLSDNMLSNQLITLC
jgi:hypothetical protein